MKNIIIIIVGAILVFLVITRLGDRPVDPVVETPTESTLPETKITSLKGVEIFVDNPRPGYIVTSPLTVHGRAPGNWFFEANAGITLTDWDGLIIAEGYIMAEGDWMTTDYVPFTGTITFTKPAYGERGTLIFKKDNPSGEPQFDDSAEMMIKFQ